MEKATPIATCVSSITKNSSSVLLCDNFSVRKNNSTFSIENRYCDILRGKRRSDRESICRSIAGKRLAVNGLTMFVRSTNKKNWSESNMSRSRTISQTLDRYSRESERDIWRTINFAESEIGAVSFSRSWQLEGVMLLGKPRDPLAVRYNRI